jgi:hypothetical protein
MSDDALIELKDRAAALLFAVPGVTAVGLGGRERAGRPTGEIVLKVFVARKRPARELTPGELLPERFESLGVDVDEMSESIPVAGETGPAPPEPGSPATSEGDSDEADIRPGALKGGIALQFALSGVSKGTLGCFLVDPADPNKVYALTAFHVAKNERGFGPDAGSTKVGHPDSQDGPTKCCQHVIGRFAAGDVDPVRDAAVIRLDPGIQWLAEITGLGLVTGSDSVTVGSVAPLTYQVRKRGIRTGITGGTLLSTSTTVVEKHPVTQHSVSIGNVMVIRPNLNAGVRADGDLFFADQRDSGSALVNDRNKVVGLIFGRAASGPRFNAHAVSISAVLQRFATLEHLTLQVAAATQLGQVHTVPGTPPSPAAPGLASVASMMSVASEQTASTADAFGRVGDDLGASPAGRALRALWTEHGTELLELVNTRRRVTLAWHRDGGPALTQSLIRAATDPGARIPVTTAGRPPMERLARIHAVLRANASPGLRSALDDALTGLPDPAGLTYDQFLTALAAGD